MENSEHPHGSCLRFDDVVIERGNFRIWKNGQAKSLTPRAFDVLVYLIEHRGRVVEKQEIFEALWKETFVTDNALMRAIQEIRRALGDEASAPRYIETVHKRGYRFMAEIAEPVESGTDSTGLKISDTGLQTEIPSQNQFESGNSPFTPTENRIRRSEFKIPNWLWLIFVLLTFLAFAFWFSGSRNARQIDSIAVLPFVNESGNTDLEYLSDGMSETLIGNLSQIPNLNVKARFSVFRYKGREINAQTIGRELNVQAVLIGRVVQRGDELTLYLSLVDTVHDNNLWSKQYNRKLTNLISLQSEIARDVASNLQTKLSGAETQKVGRRYTDNVEAYQLYLKGRYFLLKVTPSAQQTAISYFEQAIELDPSYALAYTGISDVYLSQALSSEMPPMQVFPKAKAAAQKAVEIDDQLAEAHTEMGQISFWYDWNKTQAEYHFKRALELNPNYADVHLYYCGLLSVTGRQAEAMVEGNRAIELDPLNLRTSTLEGQYLIQARRVDEGLARLQKTIELEPNFFLAHQFAANAYIQKGMYAQAIAEARRAKELSGGIPTIPMLFLGYALAKSGKPEEAQAVLDELLKSSKDRYVSPFVIALIYHALGRREETFKWLERGIEQRDPRMILLQTDAKCDDLRHDPRFQEIMKRAGLN